MIASSDIPKVEKTFFLYKKVYLIKIRDNFLLAAMKMKSNDFFLYLRERLIIVTIITLVKSESWGCDARSRTYVTLVVLNESACWSNRISLYPYRQATKKSETTTDDDSHYEN